MALAFQLIPDHRKLTEQINAAQNMLRDKLKYAQKLFCLIFGFVFLTSWLSINVAINDLSRRGRKRSFLFEPGK